MSRVNKTKTGNHSWYVGNTKIAELDSATALGQLAGMQQVQDAAANKPSYYFNGVTTTAITCPNNPILGNAVLTEVVKFKRSSLAATAASQFLICTGSSVINEGFNIYLSTSGQLIADAVIGAGAITGPVINDYNWHTAIAFYDLTAIYLYLDGIYIGKTAYSALSLTATPIVIGNRLSTRPYSGNIAYGAIFNYAISADKIARYSAGAKLDFEDIGGNMDVAASCTWTDFSSSLSLVSNGRAITSFNADVDLDRGFLSSFPIVAGKTYRVYFSGYTGSLANVMQFYLVDQNTSGIRSNIAYLTATSGYVDLVSTYTDSLARLYFRRNNATTATSGAITIDRIAQLGAILDLEPESMTTTVWHDESGNGLDGIVTGAQLVNLPHILQTDYGRAAVVQELQSKPMASYNFPKASSASVSVAHNSVLEVGLNNFTVLSTIAPTEYPASNSLYFYKENGVINWGLQLQPSGTMRFALRDASSNTQNVDTISAVPLKEITTFVGTRDATGLKLYKDGLLESKLETTVVRDLTMGAGNLVVSWPNTTSQILGASYRNILFNYSLPEDKIRRYSAGAKLDWEDVGGSMSELCLNSGFTGSSANWVATGFAYSSNNIIAAGAQAGGAYVSQIISTSFVKGKRYRVSVKVDTNTNNIPLTFYGNDVSGGTPVATSVILGSGTGILSLEFTANYTSGAGNAITIGNNANINCGSPGITIDYISIVQLGAVLDLEPEMIAPTQWRDVSGNTLHGAVTGALVTSRITASHETGTWVPTFTPSSGAYGTAPTVNSALYTKVGRQVSFQLDVTQGTVGTAAGAFEFTLPFNTEGAGVYSSIVQRLGDNKSGSAVGYAINSQRAFLYDGTTLWGTSTRLIITGTYFTAI